MRIRTTAAVAAAALALLWSVPGQAVAARGVFRYTYVNELGVRTAGELTGPADGSCTDVPEDAAGRGEPAFAPQNLTDDVAMVHLFPGCTGPAYLLPPGGSASDRLLLRSVRFLPL
ncbi:hypothetical protein AB0D08_09725 [Kitasatospora sp. NPDC048540]|uniref:hypothetical protein n=1 Tax=Kitasatospora sp. NPDC048540 TaxID=3155634 RepID=UPI0033D651F2